MLSSSEKNAAPPPKPVQYSMRSLLAVMGVMAILAAVAGVHYRQCNPGSLPYLMVLWASILPGMAWYFLSFERKRFGAHSLAGACFVRLPRSSLFWSFPSLIRLNGIFLVLIGGIWITVFSDGCATSSPAKGSFLGYTLHGLICGFFIQQGLMQLRGKTYVLLCVNGVLSETDFIPWDEIRRIAPIWGTKYDIRTVYSTKGKSAFRVPAELREQVDTLLKEKLDQLSVVPEDDSEPV